MSAKVIELNQENFDGFLSDNDVIVVDFWANWCGPCKMLSPVIEELANDYEGKVVFGKVNVDDNPELSEKFEIMSIPAVYIYKAGKVSQKIIGFRQKTQISSIIDEVLKAE